MDPAEMLDDKRCVLRANPRFTFVARDEFCKLLLSSQRLVRSDEPRSQVRGLLDLDTGKRFLIEQENLFGRLT